MFCMPGNAQLNSSCFMQTPEALKTTKGRKYFKIFKIILESLQNSEKSFERGQKRKKQVTAQDIMVSVKSDT